MRHAYYSYTREELLSNNPKLPVLVMENNEAVFRSMAEEMAEEIKSHNEKGEKTVFICPVGPVGQYPFFVEKVNTEKISLKNVWFINMDEYLEDDKKWVPETHPLSFRGFMNREVYGKIEKELLMPEEQRVFPYPENLGYIPDLIEKLRCGYLFWRYRYQRSCGVQRSRRFYEQGRISGAEDQSAGDYKGNQNCKCHWRF